MANIPFLNNAYFAAKVGIGVPTPNESLEVSGSILLSSRLKLGTGDHYLQQTSGDIYSFTTGKNIMYAGSAEVFRVDEAKLATFKGDAYFNSGLITTIDSEGSFYIDVNANNAYGGRNFRVLNNGTTYFNIDADGNVGIGTTSPDEKLRVDGNAKVAGDVISSALKLGFAGSANITTNDTNEDLLINPNGSGDILMHTTSTGNVGIGASSPDSKLNINGNSGDPSATYTTTAANSTISIGDFSASGLRMLFGVNPSTPSTWIQNQYTTNQVTAKLLLNPLGGNVGIGTTSPTEKLHIFGTTAAVKIEGDGVTSANLKFKTNETDRWNVNVPSGSTDLRFTTGSSDTLTLKSNGNVGIGTTSPSEKLDIEGNVRVGQNNGFYINNQNVGIKRDSNDLVLGGFGNVIIKSSSTTVVNQAERMRITSAGNVGIGTTSPDYKLDVEGDISLVGGGENYAVMSPISQGMQIAVGDPADIAVPLVTFDGENQRVGIGTTNPAAKLDIESTTSGVLLPRMTTAQVNAISSPSNGLTVYNTTLNTLCFYNGSSWQKVNHANM